MYFPRPKRQKEKKKKKKKKKRRKPIYNLDLLSREYILMFSLPKEYMNRRSILFMSVCWLFMQF